MTQNNWNSPLPVPIASGGTNASSMSTANSTVAYNGTEFVTTVGNKFLIEEQTVSGTPTYMTFTTGFSSDYNLYVFEFYRIIPSAGSFLNFQISLDAGATWETTGPYSSSVRITNLGASPTITNNGIYTGRATLTGESGGINVHSTFGDVAGSLTIYNMISIQSSRMMSEVIFGNLSNQTYLATGGHVLQTSGSPATGVRFNFNTSTFASGKIRLYGIT